MKIEERITAFHHLDIFLAELDENDFQSIAVGARNENPWFTEASVRMAVRGIRRLLTSEELQNWIADYDLRIQPKKIAVVMAGNIPMAGFHDFLSILISGHAILIKCSKKDSVLMHFIADNLTKIEPRFKDRIEFAEQLKGFDAIIATGSDNTSRYFEYYFSKYPNIIRKNRTSVAILNGSESDEELQALGTDIFSYFGLGCRNVSKVFLPQGYSLARLFENWVSYHDIIHHHKYCNNYDYQKSILLVARTPFLDNGFVMLEEHQKLVSPIAVVYYQFYQERDSIENFLRPMAEKIQCIVGNTNNAKVKFGQAQFPGLRDYADQIDTLKFLTKLN